MDQIGRVFDLAMRYAFFPALDWVLAHPIISLAAVAFLVFWSVRNWRML
jgi:hypothetical protein